MKKPFLGIAFGGGGFRGAAHIGVLQVLQKNGINAEIVSGVSAGSIVAAMYALKLDPFWIEKKFRETLVSTKFKKVSNSIIKNKNQKSLSNYIPEKWLQYFLAIISLNKKYIVKNKPLKEMLKLLLKDNHFKDLKIPLKVIATDINNGQDILYDSGNLIDSILRSSSIPGVIEPLIKDGKVIVDGGVGLPIPVSAIKNHCEFVIAIDIGLYKLKPIKNLNAASIKKRSNIITSNRLKERLASEADFVIKPDTMGSEWSNLDNAEKIFENGKIAAEESIALLREKMEKKKKQIGFTKNG